MLIMHVRLLFNQKCTKQLRLMWIWWWCCQEEVQGKVNLNWWIKKCMCKNIFKKFCFVAFFAVLLYFYYVLLLFGVCSAEFQKIVNSKCRMKKLGIQNGESKMLRLKNGGLKAMNSKWRIKKVKNTKWRIKKVKNSKWRIKKC